MPEPITTPAAINVNPFNKIDLGSQNLLALNDMSSTSSALQSALSGSGSVDAGASADLADAGYINVMDDSGNRLTLTNDNEKKIVQKISYHPGGKKSAEINYDSSKRPSSEFNFDKDGKTKIGVVYYKDGKMDSELKYKGDKVISKQSYKDGKLDEKVEYGLALSRPQAPKGGGKPVEVKEPYVKTTKYDSSGAMMSLQKTFVVSSDQAVVDQNTKNLKPRAENGLISYTEIYDKKGNITSTKEDFIQYTTKNQALNSISISEKPVISNYSIVKQLGKNGELIKSSIYQPLSNGQMVLTRESDENSGDSETYKYDSEGKAIQKIETNVSDSTSKCYRAEYNPKGEIKWKKL